MKVLHQLDERNSESVPAGEVTLQILGTLVIERAPWSLRRHVYIADAARLAPEEVLEFRKRPLLFDALAATGRVVVLTKGMPQDWISIRPADFIEYMLRLRPDVDGRTLHEVLCFMIAAQGSRSTPTRIAALGRHWFEIDRNPRPGDTAEVLIAGPLQDGRVLPGGGPDGWPGEVLALLFWEARRIAIRTTELGHPDAALDALRGGGLDVVIVCLPEAAEAWARMARELTPGVVIEIEPLGEYLAQAGNSSEGNQ